jgi:murein DD-endopeptidase MepM/ murein hydrolase activator NlpD
MVVNIGDIPDFPNLPGQRPTVGETPDVSPVPVVLVYAPIDSDGAATPINAAAVDAYISAEITAGRAHSTTVERWSPWGDLQLQLGFKIGSGYNYARFTLADGSKWYAYLDAEYLNLTDTRYRVSPDDWTTYAPALGYSMVRRGHVAVAASQSDTYGDQFLLEPEPIDAPPVWGAVNGDALDDALSTWTAVVVSANDLRGLGDTPYFEPHRNSGYIGAAATQATDATAGIDSDPQFEIAAPEYPWSDLVATVGYFWPFSPSTFNVNNGEPGDGFRTPERPTHNGMDMGFGVANIEGTPIKAAKGGTVTFAGVDGSYGNRVVIDHGDGYRSTYSHMFETPDVSDGETVSGGTTLGGIGTTGGSTGNHLHFEIYDVAAGDYIDPMGFMAVENPSDLVVGDTPLVESEIYIPKVTPAIPSTVDGVAAGGGVFTFSMAGLVNYLAIMQNAPWVLDGISSIRLVPSWAVANTGGSPSALGTPPRSPSDPEWDTAADIPVYHSELVTAKPTVTAISDWRASALSAAGAGTWRKLLTSQFCEVVVAGSDQAALMPELIQSSNIQVQAVAGSVSGGSDVALPVNYSMQGELTAIGLDASGLAGMMTSGYGQALRDPATLDLAFAQLGWGNAYNRVVMIQQYALAISAAVASAQINLGTQGVQTLLGSAMGGPVGLAAGAANVATSAISSSLNMGVLDMKLEESVEIAAYQLGVSGIMGSKSVDAVVQAANSQSGRGGFESVGGWRPAAGAGVSVVVKLPAPDRVRAAISMFERYGYTVGRAMVPPRIDPMDHYSYWQVDDASILGAMPDDARRRLVERFARGTTVWQSVAEIGTRPSNAPRSGVSY